MDTFVNTVQYTHILCIQTSCTYMHFIYETRLAKCQSLPALVTGDIHRALIRNRRRLEAAREVPVRAKAKS